MNVEHVSEVKKSIGPQAVKILTDIFRSSTGIPPGVHAARYRADHPELIEIIDRLETANLFLERDRTNCNYVIRVYGLPTIEDEHAENMLQQMDSIFQFFKSEYKKRLSDQIRFSEILTALNLDFSQTAEILSYMVQSHSVWCGLSNNFPNTEDSAISISEQVLRYETFGEILSEFFEWHIINPHKIAVTLSPCVDDILFNTNGFFTQDHFNQKPKWFAELDDIKKALICEIHDAVKQGLSALPMIGLRTLFELIMLDKIEDQKTFAKNIKKFHECGFITLHHARVLEKVVDAGNASAHRAYFPNKEDLRTCIEVLNHLLHGIYVLNPKVDRVANNTPKRGDKKLEK